MSLSKKERLDARDTESFSNCSSLINTESFNKYESTDKLAEALNEKIKFLEEYVDKNKDYKSEKFFTLEPIKSEKFLDSILSVEPVIDSLYLKDPVSSTHIDELSVPSKTTFKGDPTYNSNFKVDNSFKLTVVPLKIPEKFSNTTERINTIKTSFNTPAKLLILNAILSPITDRRTREHMITVDTSKPMNTSYNAINLNEIDPDNVNAGDNDFNVPELKKKREGENIPGENTTNDINSFEKNAKQDEVDGSNMTKEDKDANALLVSEEDKYPQKSSNRVWNYIYKVLINIPPFKLLIAAGEIILDTLGTIIQAVVQIAFDIIIAILQQVIDMVISAFQTILDSFGFGLNIRTDITSSISADMGSIVKNPLMALYTLLLIILSVIYDYLVTLLQSKGVQYVGGICIGIIIFALIDVTQTHYFVNRGTKRFDYVGSVFDEKTINNTAALIRYKQSSVF